MSFDLDTAKDRLGILDNSQDAEIQVMLDTAMAVAENYCDRKFEHGVEDEYFIYKTNESFPLIRYPIIVVNAANNEKGQKVADNLYEIASEAGLLKFAGGYPYDCFSVNYEGGYITLPLDLELALWSIFDKIYSQTQTSAGGGGIVVGGIESVAITGVGSVKYSSGSDSSTIGADNSLISSMAYSVLKKYVRVLS